jgi:hypothetical protein
MPCTTYNLIVEPGQTTDTLPTYTMFFLRAEALFVYFTTAKEVNKGVLFGGWYQHHRKLRTSAEYELV